MQCFPFLCTLKQGSVFNSIFIKSVKKVFVHVVLLLFFLTVILKHFTKCMEHSKFTCTEFTSYFRNKVILINILLQTLYR